MGRSNCNGSLVLAALCIYMLTVSTYAQEFLSIDCGGADGQTDDLGIKWVTDETFVQTGKKLQVLVGQNPLASLRYFPENRTKNCYVLPVVAGTTYLLRTIFFPGIPTDASSKVIEFPVNFNITMNNNVFYTYSAVEVADRLPKWQEATFYSFDKAEIYVCIIKGTAGFPFINTIELRELNSTSYAVVKTNEIPQFMVASGRYNTGTAPDAPIISYPDDPYDRYWQPVPNTTFDLPAFTNVVNSSTLAQYTTEQLVTVNQNHIPEKVRMDAWVGRDLSITYPKQGDVKRLFVGWYLQEIRPVNATDLQANPLVVTFGVNDYESSFNISNRLPRQLTLGISVNASDPTFKMTVTTDRGSKRVAILNAFEVHYLYELDVSATNVNDETILKVLQESFGLQDWTGDPCYPVAWDWVTCEPEASRITELKLSNMNITGVIPEKISELTQLTEIHLDNNNLSGAIPPSMRSLRNLQVLALDNNNLSGEIPFVFQNKPGFTFTGNPGICLVGENCPSSAPAPGPRESPAKSDDDSNEKIYIGVIVGLCVVIAALIAALASCYLRGNRYKSKAMPVTT